LTIPAISGFADGYSIHTLACSDLDRRFAVGGGGNASIAGGAGNVSIVGKSCNAYCCSPIDPDDCVINGCPIDPDDCSMYPDACPIDPDDCSMYPDACPIDPDDD